MDEDLKVNGEQLILQLNKISSQQPAALLRRIERDKEDEKLVIIFENYQLKKTGEDWDSETTSFEVYVKGSSTPADRTRILKRRVIPFLRLEFPKQTFLIDIDPSNLGAHLLT